MLEYRVTKYDPASRDERGAYKEDDWTSVSDIGGSFAGRILTPLEYERVERAYVTAALSFMEEAGVASVTVEELENPQALPLSLGEGSVLTLEQLSPVICQILREEYWCRLEGDGGFIHFGYDYYMYVGVARACPSALATSAKLGLFVEEFALGMR